MPAFQLGSDGAGAKLLTLPATGTAPLSPSQSPHAPVGMTMNGPETFKFGVRVLVETTEAILREVGLTPQEVEWLVPHQANQRIMTAGAKRLGFIDSQVMSNIEEYGNTSAASIPIAIADWVARDLVRSGHRLLMVGFGAGLTWAGGLMTWRD